jgi:hypothetical protein
MKQLLLFIAALSALFVLSCAKNNPPEPADPVIPPENIYSLLVHWIQLNDIFDQKFYHNGGD